MTTGQVAAERLTVIVGDPADIVGSPPRSCTARRPPG